jgi:prepilin-type N-terminal cleavage/methylation domain-containing protein
MQSTPLTKKTHRRVARGFSLIEILVVVAIILILSAIYLPRLTGGRDPLSGKRHASPTQKAHQVATVSYVGQIQQAISMYKMDNEDRLPQNLQELKRYGVTEEMLMDGASGQPLLYNPQTGEVTSPMPLTPPKN